jgi:hypothetical protein
MRKYLESILWATALLLLYFMDTSKETTSFCLFRIMGFHYCPGCGIGHAIHEVLHFRFADSFKYHLMGIPASAGILYLIVKPLISTKQTKLTWTLNKC